MIEKLDALTDTQRQIVAVCDEVKQLLLQKNRAYGNSATNPVRVFSKASPEEQILVRLDDKISRLSRGSAAGEDVVTDLIGYLVLLKVVRRMAQLDEAQNMNTLPTEEKAT